MLSPSSNEEDKTFSSPPQSHPHPPESTYNLTYRMMDNRWWSLKDQYGRIHPWTFLQNLIVSAKENHTIELLMFFHMFGYTCTNVTVQNLYLDRLCRLEYNYSEEICKNLSHYSDYEQNVEKRASVFTMYRNTIEALIPVLFALFLGPFVDRNGSKLPILFCLTGYIVASLMYCFASMIPSIPAGPLLICSIPISLTGGLVAFLMSAFTLISNNSTVANRSFRVAVLEGCWFLGAIGFLIAAKIYNPYGFTPVFLLSAFCFSAALAYGIYYIQEPPGKNMDNISSRHFFREVFDLQSVKDTLAAVAKPRDGPLRFWLILLMITIFLRMLALFGTMQVAYLYTRNKFGWDLSSFSKFTSIDSAITLCGGLVTLICMKVLKLRDACIGIFSASGFVISNLCFAAATSGWVMYLGVVLQMFCGLITIVMRSMVSKCVSKNELAKAFAFVSIGEACMPILAGLLFNLLYNSTLTTFPGAVFALSALFHLIILLHFIYFYFATRDYPFGTLSEED